MSFEQIVGLAMRSDGLLSRSPKRVKSVVADPVEGGGAVFDLEAEEDSDQDGRSPADEPDDEGARYADEDLDHYESSFM